MKLRAHLADNEYDISLGLSGGVAAVEINGRQRNVEVRELTESVFLIIDGAKIYRCRVEPVRGSKDMLAVTVGGKDYEIRVIDPKRLRSGQTSGAHQHGAAEIVSPMPGKVVRVLCEIGATVELGAGIIVVEAMKMQNEMKAPKAGVVVSINVEPGAAVNAGDVLAVIE